MRVRVEDEDGVGIGGVPLLVAPWESIGWVEKEDPPPPGLPLPPRPQEGVGGDPLSDATPTVSVGYWEGEWVEGKVVRGVELPPFPPPPLLLLGGPTVAVRTLRVDEEGEGRKERVVD